MSFEGHESQAITTTNNHNLLLLSPSWLTWLGLNDHPEHYQKNNEHRPCPKSYCWLTLSLDSVIKNTIHKLSQFQNFSNLIKVILISQMNEDDSEKCTFECTHWNLVIQVAKEPEYGGLRRLRPALPDPGTGQHPAQCCLACSTAHRCCSYTCSTIVSPFP